jgi:acetyltransferase-like isoleucine patch superfamily enzyme
MSLAPLEPVFLRMTRGFVSRLRLRVYRAFGMRHGIRNRMEGSGRCRRLSQIEIGSYNAFTQGCWLWPEDADYKGVRIRIGNWNYFNRNVMIDACGLVEIGDENMFGPDIYITDSNHTVPPGVTPHNAPMARGRVKIGNGCWIGAKVVILKDVELGDGCVVAAGAVVTKSFPAGQLIAGVPGRALPRKGEEQLLTSMDSGSTPNSTESWRTRKTKA